MAKKIEGGKLVGGHYQIEVYFHTKLNLNLVYTISWFDGAKVVNETVGKTAKSQEKDKVTNSNVNGHKKEQLSNTKENIVVAQKFMLYQKQALLIERFS